MTIPAGDAPLFEILHTCRAMRRLKPDPIPEQLLLQLVDAALHGPSGSNAQNWRFVIVRDGEQKKKIQALWRKTRNFYQETLAKAELRPGEKPEDRRKATATGTYMVEHIHEVPALICVCVAKDEAIAKALASPATLVKAVQNFGLTGAIKLAAGGGRTRGLIDGSTAYPAVQNLLLAARALGLGAVLTTPHFFVPGQFEEVLGIPSTVTLAAVIPLGYPMGKFGPVKRPHPREVVSWDHYAK